MMTEAEIFEALRAALGADLLAAEGAGADSIARVAPRRAREALTLLRDRLGFNVLVDLTAADLLRLPRSHASGVWDPCQATPGTQGLPSSAPEGRFEITYRLMKLDAGSGLVLGRTALKTRVSEGEPAPPTVRDLWPCADWLEREIWDMFGVKPSDRPEIKRLLLYEEFQGHPLRKDYPIAKRQPLIAPLPRTREPIDPKDLRPRIAP